MLGSIARTLDPRVGDCAQGSSPDCATDTGTMAAVMPPPDPAAMDAAPRGCIQVVLWGWMPDGEVLGAAGAEGVGEHLARQLAARLDEQVAQAGIGSVQSVSVQVGQARAVLGGPSADTRPADRPVVSRASCDGSSASVRLLQMSPPAASSVTAAGGPAPLAVRLLLHSPTPQPARVLVLAEQQGPVNSSTEPSGGGPRAGGLAPHVPTPARLLLELPVQLECGVQEVQLAVGAAELAEAVGADGVEGVWAGEGDAVGVLRLMMVGPEHAAADVGGQLDDAASASSLVHWVAPPLLLLPPAAAAEVCSAWEAMQREVQGGLAETQEQGMGLEQQQQQQPGGEEQQAEAGGSSAPPTETSQPWGASELQDDRAEWRSALWWSHMVPLLVDLAHVLRGQGPRQEGGEEGAAVVRQEGYAAGDCPVWETLAAYLRGNGMAHTLSLLSRRNQHGHHACTTYAMATSVAAADAEPGLVPPLPLSANQPSGPLPPSSGSHHLWGNGIAQTLPLLSRRSQARTRQHERQVCVSYDMATSTAAAVVEPGLVPPMPLSASQPTGHMPPACGSSHLRGNGMAQTSSLLSRRSQARTRQQEHQVCVSYDMATSVAGGAGAGAEAGMVTSTLLCISQPSGPMPPPGGSNWSETSHRQPPTRTGAYPAGPGAHSKGACPFLFSLPHAFYPPPLEFLYQQWRLERLARFAPYALLLFDAGVCLSLLLRALAFPRMAAPVSGGAAGASALMLPLLRSFHTVSFALLTTVADMLGLAALYVMVVLRPRHVARNHQQQQQRKQHKHQSRQSPSRQQERRRQGGAWGAPSPGTTPAVLISSRDVLWYRLAACVAGPAVVLLCGLLTALGVTPLDPRGVGNARAVLGSCLVRAVIVPCLQQMSTWEALAAAPLMGCGEALVLMCMQPTWGVWRAGAVAAVWRLVGVGVSAAWERRSRDRFVQL